MKRKDFIASAAAFVAGVGSFFPRVLLLGVNLAEANLTRTRLKRSVDIHTGEQLSTDKRAWYEGRGIWVYSFLYNNIKQDPHYLEVARKSKDFILKLQPSEGNFWNASFSRVGKPLSGPEDIYGNLLVFGNVHRFLGFGILI